MTKQTALIRLIHKLEGDGFMPDLASIGLALTSLKTAGEIAKTFIGLKNTADIQAKVIELQSVILAAQSSALDAQASQRTLLDNVRELEEEMARLKAWDTEKQRYELQQRSSLSPGVLAYRVKEAERRGEPDHWLCANCFEDAHKSVLQERPGDRRMTELNCPRCKTTVPFYE